MRMLEWTANTLIKSCFMGILVISLSQIPFSTENVARKRREERMDGSELLYQLHSRFWHLSPTAQNEVRTEIKVRRHLDTWQRCTWLTQQSNSNLNQRLEAVLGYSGFLRRSQREYTADCVWLPGALHRAQRCRRAATPPPEDFHSALRRVHLHSHIPGT